MPPQVREPDDCSITRSSLSYFVLPFRTARDLPMAAQIQAITFILLP